jgi:hypothetical protein
MQSFGHAQRLLATCPQCLWVWQHKIISQVHRNERILLTGRQEFCIANNGIRPAEAVNAHPNEWREVGGC